MESFELGKFTDEVENWEKNEVYEKCNTFLQTFIKLVKLLFCLFGKVSDLILSLNMLKKCSVSKILLKNFVTSFQTGKFF